MCLRSTRANSSNGNGTELYVYGKGYIWQLSLDGGLSLVAGTGIDIDFPADDYDPFAEHPALELSLHDGGGALTEGTYSFMTYENGALYWTGENEVATYVQKIGCE